MSLPAKAQQLLRARRVRDETFGSLNGMLGETAFDILLLLFVAEGEGRLVTTSAASTAGDAAPSTGLRWLNALFDLELIERHDDPHDHRVRHIALSRHGRETMTRYLERL